MAGTPDKKRHSPRRRPHTGPAAPRYFRTLHARNGNYLRTRERVFAENFVEGFINFAPSFIGLSKKKFALVLRALCMDAIANSPYRCRTEKALMKQAAYLTNMPRVQREIENIFARKGLGMPEMAATLGSIMDGTATTTSIKDPIEAANPMQIVCTSG